MNHHAFQIMNEKNGTPSLSVSYPISLGININLDKVRIFWEGHKIEKIFHLKFDVTFVAFSDYPNFTCLITCAWGDFQILEY
jgi:hypothetical protein